MTSLEITVVAISTVLGPILAVQAQKWIERVTERGRSRRAIFSALMANRATRLHDDFVRALNLIDLEFQPKGLNQTKDRSVINAWRALFGEYHDAPPDGSEQHIVVAWNGRINDRLVDLLYAMSGAVGYNFSQEELRRGIYYPRGRYDLEQTQLAILRGLKGLLEGQSAVPMRITEVPSSPELIEAQTEMLKRSAKAYGDDGIFRIRIEK